MQRQGFTNRRLRVTLCIGCVISGLIACHQISLRLIAQIHVAQAERFFQRAHYGAIASHLKKADAYQPNDPKIQKALGDVWLKLGELAVEPKDAFERIQKTKDFHRAGSEKQALPKSLHPSSQTPEKKMRIPGILHFA